jgi:restriction endonuclease Mrr
MIVQEIERDAIEGTDLDEIERARILASGKVVRKRVQCDCSKVDDVAEITRAVSVVGEAARVPGSGRRLTKR